MFWGGGVTTSKTIVLLGSMVPYNQSNSDALFNLGAAIAAVQILPEGVYVAMNGKIFAWNNVRKNKEYSRFEASDPAMAMKSTVNVTTGSESDKTHLIHRRILRDLHRRQKHRPKTAARA